MIHHVVCNAGSRTGLEEEANLGDDTPPNGERWIAGNWKRRQI